MLSSSFVRFFVIVSNLQKLLNENVLPALDARNFGKFRHILCSSFSLLLLPMVTLLAAVSFLNLIPLCATASMCRRWFILCSRTAAVMIFHWERFS